MKNICAPKNLKEEFEDFLNELRSQVIRSTGLGFARNLLTSILIRSYHVVQCSEPDVRFNLLDFQWKIVERYRRLKLS